MSGPFARVPVDQRRTLGRAATALTILLFGAIAVLGVPLRSAAAPLGLVSLQFAGSPDAAESMLVSWAEVARGRLLWAHGLDLLLPIAYASAIGLRAATAAAAVSRARGAATLAAGSVLAAASADQVENAALFVTLLVAPSWSSVLATLVAATVKWAMLVIAVGALVAVMAVERTDGRRHG